MTTFSLDKDIFVSYIRRPYSVHQGMGNHCNYGIGILHHHYMVMYILPTDPNRTILYIGVDCMR